ncbi:MAG TPA: serine protease [Polyangiaceae bacterium]|nr:serine protease [Polyangiaceae bacterium]
MRTSSGLPRVRAGLLLLSSSLLAAAPALASANADLNAAETRARVRAATVTLPAKGCAGSVVGSDRLVVTAAHCVPRGAESVAVRLPDRRSLQSSVLHLDRMRDVALLELEQPSGAAPLELAADVPAPGGHVLFVGRIDRASRAQTAEVKRIGRCPSLPDIDDAVFTNIKAKPGDSGAPIVDESLRVIGVIHGGSACHIVAPTRSLAPAIDAAKAGQPQPGPSVVDSAPTEADDPAARANGAEEPALRRYQVGPFVFERIPSGFRFKFAFDFGFGSER